MSPAAFIDRCRELHDRAKKGALPPALHAEYLEARSELARLMLVAQQLGHGGPPPVRAALRIAQLIKVEIDVGGLAPERTSTMDLASGGFAALLMASQPVGKSVTFTLHLPAFPSGIHPMKGTAKVVSSRAQGDLHRISFSLDETTPVEQDHLEMVIIDFILRRFMAPG